MLQKSFHASRTAVAESKRLLQQSFQSDPRAMIDDLVAAEITCHQSWELQKPTTPGKDARRSVSFRADIRCALTRILILLPRQRRGQSISSPRRARLAGESSYTRHSATWSALTRALHKAGPSSCAFEHVE